MTFFPLPQPSAAFSELLLQKLTAPYSAFARAVVAGTAKGTILVDDAASPREALILSQERMWWQPLVAFEDLPPLPRDALMLWLRENGPSVVSIYADVPVATLLRERLRDWRCAVEKAIVFEKSLTNLEPAPSVPEGLRMLPFTDEAIRAAVLGDEQDDLLEEASKVRERVGSGFPGFFLVNAQGQFVAWCLVDCIHGDVAEIGVETARAFRKKGMSTCCVLHVQHELARLGLRKLLWHAGLGNVPSQKTALRTGFIKAFDTEFRQCAKTLSHNVLACGWLAAREGDKSRGADLYEEAVKMAREQEGSDHVGEFTCDDVLEWVAEMRQEAAQATP